MHEDLHRRHGGREIIRRAVRLAVGADSDSELPRCKYRVRGVTESSSLAILAKQHQKIYCFFLLNDES